MPMKASIKTGTSFGLTSGVITTLGLMVGLHSGTGSRLVVMGGIVTIAIADAASDALGIHVSEEAENVHTPREIWAATLATFLSKLAFALSFLVPVAFLPLWVAVLVSVAWGLAVLSVFSCKMAIAQKQRPLKVILEHLVIAVAVIASTNLVGSWVAATFSE